MLRVFYQFYDTAALSIRETVKLEHRLGRQLLRTGLQEIFGLCFSERELEDEILYGKNGKPFLGHFPYISFNISHCDGLVVCAFHRGCVGVDAEKPGYFAEVLIRRALAPEEADFLRIMGTTRELREEWFFRFWTLKEAYVKMTGTGVDVALTDFSFAFGSQNQRELVTCSDEAVCCRQVRLDSGHIISICYEKSPNATPAACEFCLIS